MKTKLVVYLILIAGMLHTSILEGKRGIKSKEISLKELKDIQGKLKSFKTLAVDVTQTKFSHIRPHKPRTYEGNAIFAKPNRFRWTVKFPTGTEEWIYDGKRLLNYIHQEKTATSYPANNQKARDISEITKIFLSLNALLEKYSVESANEKLGTLYLKLKPKKHPNITRVELKLVVKKNFIRFVKLYFRGGNHTSFKFRNPSHPPKNKKLFQLPGDIKIVNAL